MAAGGPSSQSPVVSRNTEAGIVHWRSPGLGQTAPLMAIIPFSRLDLDPGNLGGAVRMNITSTNAVQLG